jgi:trigger factor
MNITKEKLNEESGALLRLQIIKEDYEPRVNKVLGDYKRKASIDGFRPGKVPTSIIQKLYGKSVLVDEINKLVSESLNNFLKEQNIDIIGDPIPYEKEQKTINFDTDTDFEFVFEVGLTPELEIKVTDTDVIPYFHIIVEDKVIDNYADMYARRFGEYANVTEAGENDLLKVDLVELDPSGHLLEKGIESKDTTISVDLIKDEEIKKQWIGIKTGDKKNLDIKKAYPNDYEIAQILKIKKEEVVHVTNEFEVTVNSISTFKKREINQELFDQVFGKDQIKSEEEFRGRLKEDISSNYSKESDYKLKLDLKDYFIQKYKFDLPKDFLSKWLVLINEGKFTKEQIENDYPQFEIDLKWQLIKNKIIKEAGFKVEENEVIEYAREITRNQLRQYGLSDMTNENLDQYAKQLLQKESETKRIVELIIDDKIVQYVKLRAKLEDKSITSEEFEKFFEKNK